jgi:[ribosomal protein S5]-alanine N-acetyltransferase
MAASTKIETERLVLRRPRLSDAKALHAMYGDPEVMRYIGDGSTLTPAKTRAWIEKALARWKADGFGHFVIEKDRKVIGRAGFLVWDPDEWKTGTLAELGGHAAIELGWMLAQEHWGNGYATEAAAALRDYGFKELKFERLISLIMHGNDASVKVAERLGARYVRDVGRGDWKVRLYAVSR